MTSRARKWACGFAIAAAAGAVTAPAAPAEKGHADLAAARQAARAAVLSDSTYRIIDSSAPLRMRRCWRAPGRALRCSLYRFAATPCALDGGPAAGTLCIEVIARRVWLVEVKLGDPPAARISRVVDTTSLEGCRPEGNGIRRCR
jgi:hypothetical protein